MPRFTEAEKEHIRHLLLTKGRELFSRYGLAKTSIDDIVQVCGIGKGTFYKFFSSKEELFYVILHQEEAGREQLLSQLLRDEKLSPKERIAAFFRKAFQLADENPFLRFLFEDGEYERLIRKLPRHLVESASRDNLDKGKEVIAALMDRGILRKDDPEIVAGVMQAVLMLRMHKEKLGEERFPLIMERMIDCVAKGLTRR